MKARSLDASLLSGHGPGARGARRAGRAGQAIGGHRRRVRPASGGQSADPGLRQLGAAVRQAQSLLSRHGYRVPVTGSMGLTRSPEIGPADLAPVV
jgi:hypothetical protein